MKNSLRLPAKRNSFAPNTQSNMTNGLRTVNHQPKNSMQMRFDGGNSSIQNYNDRTQTTRSKQGYVKTVQPSPNKNYNQNYHSPNIKFDNDKVFLIEKMSGINSNNKRISQGKEGNTNDLVLQNWPTNQSKYNYTTAMCTTSNQTKYTTPTPEPYFSNNISINVAQEFSSRIQQRQKELNDRSKQNLGILKEQQYARQTLEKPYNKGRRNSEYQSPSFTSNQIFYQDYKGNSKPSIIRSQSVSLSPEKQLRYQASKRESIEPTGQTKILFQDGENRNFTKKTSGNMKNYSSLSLGCNDNLKEIYERSMSRGSIKSCGTNGGEVTPRNIEQENNQKVGNLQQSMFQSRKMLLNKLKEEQKQSNMANTLHQNFKAKTESFVDYKVGQQDNKMKWPSSHVTSFRKNNKNIPQSINIKSVHQSFASNQNSIQQKLIDETLKKSKDSQFIKESNSILAVMSGDQIQNLHKLKEENRQSLRDQVLQKFYQNKNNTILNDTRDKSSYLSQCNGLSLQVGRDDFEERQQMKKELNAFLQGQITQKREISQEQKERHDSEGRQMQSEWTRFNQLKNQEEKLKKINDQTMIRDSLARIQQEKQQAIQREKNNSEMNNNRNSFAHKQQMVKQSTATKGIQQLQRNGGNIQSFREVPKRKEDDTNENNQIYKVKIMNNIHPCKQRKF